MSARSTGLLATLLIAAPVAAQPVRTVAATATSPAAAIANRPPGSNVFSPVPEKGDLYTTDTLVLLPGASFTSRNGAIAVRALPDFDGLSPLPVLETAVILNATGKEVDLDLTLERGRLELAHARADGPATARVRFADQSWTVTLEQPGSRVSFELGGRWPAGSRFKRLGPRDDPTKVPGPVAGLIFRVLHGSVALDVGGTTLGMKAPPGPAELRWDSVGGTRPQPQKRERLPAWVDPEAGLSAEGQKTAAAFEKFRTLRATDPARALDTLSASTDPAEVRVALVMAGAYDDLDRLGRSLAAARTTEERDAAVMVLRHWLGRGPGQDQRLYYHLTTASGYTDAQARTILQLLLGFSTEDTALPETYEVLIDYLTHDKPAVRNLAAWHLVRLVPGGESISLKPGATDDEAAAVQLAWRKLVPPGRVPPATRKDKE